MNKRVLPFLLVLSVSYANAVQNTPKPWEHWHGRMHASSPDAGCVGCLPVDTPFVLRSSNNGDGDVKHDLDSIRRADHTIDLGPGAGEHGGQVVAAGSPAQLPL